jgi:phosphoribosylamine--glycine ligase
MKILIVGGGGREHALAWKCAQSPRVERVFAAPGNAGTALEPKVQNVDIAADDIEALLAFAAREDIDLTLIGPEGPLVAGIVDRFTAAGRACFGPTRAAARLEGSKAYTKEFLKRHRIPTAAYAAFTAATFDPEFIRAQRLPIVVKADGLAAGKGVVICATHESAIAAATGMLGGSFGAAGQTVVIEEFLSGEEVSFIVIVSEQSVLPLATSQDHKRRDDGDQGPNTGGMGAYSPAPLVTPELFARIMREVIEPTVRGLRKDGTPYTGFLYAGLMIAADGTPNVLEFNCRLGDPETQPILMRLQSDLIELCEAALAGAGALDRVDARWDSRAALGVVMAAGGYPDIYRKGDAIVGLEAAARLPGKVFHAGTRTEAAAGVAADAANVTTTETTNIVTAGGRVLCAVGMGDTIAAAQSQAYDLVHAIHWNLVQYRRDIGNRAIPPAHP